MSKDLDKIRRAFNERVSAATTFYAEVVDVDQAERTCIVKLENTQYEDVLLYSVADKSLKGFCVVPKKGSTVLVARIGGSNKLFCQQFSEVESVVVTIGDGTRFIVTDNGFTVTRNDAGLKDTLKKLCDAISKLTVTTAVGASGTPINVADFLQIKQELDKYLEE